MVNPYITFAGECNNALEFYQSVFQSGIKMKQLYDNYVPEGVTDPPKRLCEWVLHAEMEICGTRFWFADEVSEPVTQGTMVKLTVTVPTAKDSQQIYNILSENAHVTLPPTETFYSAFHAGLIDKFGVSWNITAEELPNQQ